ncbi:MAG: transglutaminase-like domain-containing protein [Roseibacillus sp.]|nr:transglutaminase-like domain-containing protein [Roseibacillus sp.]
MSVPRLREATFLGLVLVLVGGMLFPVAGEPEPGIEALIERLDDERFAVRDEADRKLLELGQVALPALLEASESDSPEKRVRSAKLVRRIREGIIRGEFERMGKLADADLEVEHAMWVIALLLDPELEKEAVTKSLDEIATAVRKELGEGVEPRDRPPARAMAALIAVLKNQYGFAGDMVTYQHPDNSSVHRVIARRKGLPILLSEIAVAVSRRLELPVVGLGIPGRYMIKYDGRKAPGGEAGKDIIINPFEGWRETSVRELRLTVPGFEPDEHLQESPARLTILRIMRNMESHATVKGRQELVSTILDCYPLVAGPNLPLFR